MLVLKDLQVNKHGELSNYQLIQDYCFKPLVYDNVMQQ